MLKNRNVRLIFSLIIAICLWLYVMGNVDPVITNHFGSVPVTLTNESELDELGLKATLDSPKEVSVTLKGKRSRSVLFLARPKVRIEWFSRLRKVLQLSMV